jgi:hypothetical protein
VVRNAGKNYQINTTSHSRTLESPSIVLCKIVFINTRFAQKVCGLELYWLFTGWDVFATSLDMFVMS